ncbi:MAG: class III poly(R)-hydroxyalkanoic acid synthase subunit PhaC [Nitrosopumilaceae archaeon]
MQSEPRIDPKFVDEFLKFSRNVVEAPNYIPDPDKINLEMTPHDVAYAEDKIRLLHYKPLTQKQSRTPLVIVYAIINRYHILDIQPQKSWVRNLLEQGFDIYMVDWGTPSNVDKYLDFDDYVNGYLNNCVNFVRDEAGVEKVSLQGYCTGGTISTIYASLHPEKIQNIIATAPVIDGWRDTTVVSNLAKHMDVDKMVDTIGNMPPEFMYYCFSILKPFEQGVEKYINFFKNIDNKKFVDSFLRVEKWVNDTPPVPGELFRQWIKDVYQDNLLVRDKMYVGGQLVSLKKITMPIFTQVAVGDHLVSPECSMPLHYAVASEDKTLRVYPTGHVGMIASSFSQKKVLPELGQWLSEKSKNN